MAREEIKAEIYTDNGTKTHSTQSIICVHFRIVQINQVYIYIELFSNSKDPSSCRVYFRVRSIMSSTFEFDQSTHNNSNSSSVAFSMHAISKYKQKYIVCVCLCLYMRVYKKSKLKCTFELNCLNLFAYKYKTQLVSGKYLYTIRNRIRIRNSLSIQLLPTLCHSTHLLLLSFSICFLSVSLDL